MIMNTIKFPLLILAVALAGCHSNTRDSSPSHALDLHA